jgi:hypothetical protein
MTSSVHNAPCTMLSLASAAAGVGDVAVGPACPVSFAFCVRH